MNRLKNRLKKWPFLYGVVRKTWHFFRRVMETRLLGTRLQEWNASRGRGYGAESTDMERWSGQPHRRLLLDQILSYAPFETVLEKGCSAGPNLYLCASALPSARVFGVDLDRSDIETGRKYFQQSGMTNVFLSLGKADRLEQFGDKSVDVVFTDATLMFVGPDKVQGAIREAVRVARKAVIFNEWHHLGNGSFYLYAHWVHNFQQLLAKHVPPDRIKIIKLPEEAWEDANWRRYGYTVKADLTSFGTP